MVKYSHKNIIYLGGRDVIFFIIVYVKQSRKGESTNGRNQSSEGAFFVLSYYKWKIFE